MAVLYHVALTVAAGVLALGIALSLLPLMGRRGRAISEAMTRPPLLDVVLAALTAAPWVYGSARAGWIGLVASVLGQMAAAYAWIFFHELLHYQALRGPRIVHFTNRLVGRASNHLALWLTCLGVPVLWVIRILEICVYPLLIWLLRFPRYRHDEWVTLSRHKMRDLVGHDLIWCLYCDWMTGTWSLGTEMLRNVESFWCPIRFGIPSKLEHCRIDFPDIEGGWAPADATMTQVQALLEQKYGPEGDRSWFGHPKRRTPPADVEHRSAPMSLPQEMDESHREALLDHSVRPRNQRYLPAATHRAQGELPICRDRVTVFLRLEKDRIADISFIGDACAICVASASMMTVAMQDRSLAEADTIFGRFHDMMTRPDDAPASETLGDAAVLAGVSRFPARVKCATLPWHTLMAAIRQNAPHTVLAEVASKQGSAGS